METRIKELREAQGMNRRQLAARARVPYDSLGKWESGVNEINLRQAEQVARALGCKVSDLLVSPPARDERFDEIARAYRSMSEDGRTALLGAAQGLAQTFPGETAQAGLSRTA